MIRKIVSISAFGLDERYFIGAVRQFLLSQYFYPGWEFRIYTDKPERFKHLDANVIHIKDGSNGTLWRFFPLFESEANITIVRDSDGRITPREAMAVYEWMASDKTAHVMKDHETHLSTSVLAGMFGLKGSLSSECLQGMTEYLFGKSYYGIDEDYLHRYVWPKISCSLMAHEIFKGWFGLSRNFIANRHEWVGNGWYEDDRPVYPPTVKERDGFDPKALPESAIFRGYPVGIK